MAQSLTLTAQQLYRDLIAATKAPEIPEHAVTVLQFARDTGLNKKRAQDILLAEVEAGRMVRISDGKRYHYHFTAEQLEQYAQQSAINTENEE